MNILEQQYKLICSSRMVMVDFINLNLSSSLNKPVAAFSDKSIGFLLSHVADVYKFWLGELGLNLPQRYTTEKASLTIEMMSIYQLYDDVDALTQSFIERYADELNNPISARTRSGKWLNVSPLELFTHVITHEFHHKGQIMAMCRLLGKIPPDTDVIRT